MPEHPASPLRRLKKRTQFLQAARGKKIAKRGFVLQATRVDQPDAGVGYTVTKKTGNAPERNRIKRRLREAVRVCAEGFVAGHDYVLIGRRDSLTQPFNALTHELERALGRVNKGLAEDMAGQAFPEPETTTDPAQAPSGHPKP